MYVCMCMWFNCGWLLVIVNAIAIYRPCSIQKVGKKVQNSTVQSHPLAYPGRGEVDAAYAPPKHLKAEHGRP